MNYLSQFKSIISKIERHPDLKMLECNIVEGAGKDMTYNFEQQFQFSFSKELRAFYSEIDYLNIKWVLKPNHSIPLPENKTAEDIFGVINILPVDYLFESPMRQGIIDNASNENEKEELSHILPFDFFNSDSQECAAFRLDENNILQDEIFLYGLESALIKTNINLSDYIQILTKTCGYSDWNKNVSVKGRLHPVINFL
jgi:predicted nucleic-acid-binding Zn-ribbon protein